MATGNGKPLLEFIISVRISERLKRKVDRLPEVFKSKLNAELRRTVAKVIHESEFNEQDYL